MGDFPDIFKIGGILTDAVGEMAKVGRAVLDPGAGSLDPGKQTLVVDQLPVAQAPTTGVTELQFDGWIREAIREWVNAANDAVDRAYDVLKPASQHNFAKALGNMFDVTGALLGVVAPVSGAIMTVSAILLKDVLPEPGATYDLEAFRQRTLDGLTVIHKKLLDEVRVLKAGS